jgi:enamine deaminase RidA (YjgF/YER057c/UK114 family)
MEGDVSAEGRLAELGIEPAGGYAAAKGSRGMLYGSGQGPAGPDGFVIGEVFGDAGRHRPLDRRMAELPFDIAVEVELIAEVD